MNRCQLRNLLEVEVKLPCGFRIATCNNKRASINIIIPSNIRDDLGSYYEYNLDKTMPAERRKHKFVIEQVNKILNVCCIELKNKGFRNIEKEDYHITFDYPEKYSKPLKSYRRDICCQLEVYALHPKICLKKI